MKKKICLLGDGSVGKTSLIRKFVYDQFSDDYIITIGTKVSWKELNLSGLRGSYKIKLMIWDIIGQREFEKLQHEFFRGAHGALVVSDLSRYETFENLRYWIRRLKAVSGEVPFIFLGNKNDLDSKEISKRDLETISADYETEFMFTSAKTGENVERAFTLLGRNILADHLREHTRQHTTASILDRIVVDFCNTNGGVELAMPLFKQEFEKIGANFSNPSVNDLQRLGEALAGLTSNLLDDAHADLMRKRYSVWIAELQK